MRIAVIHHDEDRSNDYAAYLNALLDDLAAANGYAIKDYHIIKLAKEPLTSENTLLHIIIPASGNFSIKYWYNIKLPRLFKKYQVEKVLCMYGICSNANVRQMLILPDKNLTNSKKEMPPWQKFAAKHLIKNIEIAQTVITYSEDTKKVFQEDTQAPSEKVFVIPYTVNELFKPMEWHDKLYIKSRFAENREFFVSVLPNDDEKVFVDLLKAFSKFKKWQQSSMQLILLPKEESFTASISNRLSTYKYRDDVKLVEDADRKETADIIAASYALLHPALHDADLWPVAAALQPGIPIIAYYTKSLEEYCGLAARTVTPSDHEAFGEQLIGLYKDEPLKTQMSETAIKKTADLQQKDHSEKLWQLITESDKNFVSN
jgi:glycosyltransferase involved in cell wall biosynthesis